MKAIIVTVEKPKKEKIRHYPYVIFKTSHIGDQDIWQGSPAFLLGFAKEPKAGKIDLLFKKFWQKPKKAKGMYPVFRTSTEKWYTEKLKVIKAIKIKRKSSGNGIIVTNPNMEEIRKDHVQGDIQDQQKADAEEMKNE